MTGVRIGLILQALGAVVTALAISFTSGWKLTLVTLSFTPLLLLMGRMQGRKQGKIGQAKNKGSFTEQGGQAGAQKRDRER
jgi:hypothetical protein